MESWQRESEQGGALASASARSGIDIDFRQIRPYGQPASRANAFEELASILIRRNIGLWPGGTTFYRFGNPDGGREGKGVLPGGDVWAWQAKYLFEFDDAAASQITKSVKRTLELEPRLAKYFVALPIDLPAGDTEGEQRTLRSAQSKWNEKQADWERMAKAEGLDVHFEYVGAHALLTALTEPENAGRARYWFDASILTPAEQRDRLEEVIAKAGRRYTPQLHIDVETVRALEAVGRTDSYVRLWQEALAGLRKALGSVWRAPAGDETAFTGALDACAQSLDAAESALQSMVVAARGTGPLPEISADLARAHVSLQDLIDLLRERHLKDGNYFVDRAAALYGSAREAQGALWSASQLLDGSETASARSKTLLLAGRAGVGKTHLFCDVASTRLEGKRPTVIVLGQDFGTGPLLPQIGQLAQIGGTVDEVLDLLDAAAEAASCVGLLMIDAVNEGESSQRWADDLPVLVTKAARHPNVALAVSCRTEYVAEVVGDSPGLPRVDHPGFAEATSEAIDRYTSAYQIERPAFPVLNPEFGNPLFLKLTCEALTTLGQNHFRFGSAGLLTVCRAFLDAVNKRLARPDRCDYDEATNPVYRVASTLAASGSGPYARDEVQRLTDTMLPNRRWSQSLFHGLLNEGVLIDLYGGSVTFGYQRIGDVFRASVLAEQSVEDLKRWLGSLDDAWRETGTIGALSIITPERFGVETVDLLVDEQGRVPHYAIDAFHESLLLREPRFTTDRAVGIAAKLADTPEWADEIWDRALRLACVPDHPLNAVWLHQLLIAKPLTGRDLSWSAWLIGGTQHSPDSAVSAVLDWAWPRTPPRSPSTDAARAELPDEVASLATLALGWLLTTPDRRVRDRATKALVSIADRSPTGFAEGLRRFNGCNDPYVIERLCASACGAVLRLSRGAEICSIADAVAALVAGEWPVHLLARDYLRRVADVARLHGWTGPDWQPPYGATWPIDCPARDEVERLAGPPDYDYSSIWYSVSEPGDFGRYVLEPALRDIATSDVKGTLDLAQRAIFGRCLDLGWNPDRFLEPERSLREWAGEQVERFGKKYQWIGLYETLGRLADHHQIREVWSEDPPVPYTHAEQLVWRDIDPTVLVRPTEGQSGEPPWFARAGARYPTAVADEYPADLHGIPDPLDLIAVTSPDGTQWVSLALHANWEQELPPEVVALRAPTLSAWVQIRSYLVPTAEVESTRRWAIGKDWDGRWMPERQEVVSRLLGAHPASPDWDLADGEAEPRGHPDEPIPTDFKQCVAWYGGTGTSRGESGVEEPTGYVPTRIICDRLHLSHGVDFVWRDKSGAALCSLAHSPAELKTGLLRRDLANKLAEEGLHLFWTVLLNKQRLDHNYGRPDDDYRWISASASYILVGNTIQRVDDNATRQKPWPPAPVRIPWNLRPEG